MAKKARTSHRLREIMEAYDRRVAIYLRRSTDEDNQPYSLEAQEIKLRAFVESQPGNWQIVKIYTDDASGATTDREDLQKMLHAARFGMFDTVLVYRVDRFTRRLRDLVSLLDELDECEVVFRSATEPFDTSTPIGRMLVQMLGVFAEFEREVIIDRVIAGMERKAAKGLYNGGFVPYGYVKDPTTHNYRVVEADATIIRTIFGLYTKDLLGTRAIASVINDRGVRTRRGKPWSQRSVETVLTNRQYLGEKHFREISVIDAHEAIVERQQFDHAQRILTKRGQEIGQRATNASQYTLTGKIACPSCGHKYIGTVAHGRNSRYRYYSCWSRDRYGTQKGCGIHRFKADELEDAVGNALIDFYTKHTNLIEEAIAEFIAEHHQVTKAHSDELAAVNRELKENAAAVDRYLTAFERGTLDDDDPDNQARLTKLKSRSKQLRTRRAQIEFDLDQPPEQLAPTDLAKIRIYVAEIIQNGNHKAKKVLFEALIEDITIMSDDAVVPRFRIPTTGSHEGLALDVLAPDQPPTDGTVRVPPHRVEPRGLEPTSDRGFKTTAACHHQEQTWKGGELEADPIGRLVEVLAAMIGSELQAPTGLLGASKSTPMTEDLPTADDPFGNLIWGLTAVIESSTAA